jgi:hypothetical protein
MRMTKAALLVGIALALFAGSARADEVVVTINGSSILSEHLDGTVLQRTSLCDAVRGCVYPWHFGTPAHDGTIAFRANETPPGTAGIWLATPSGQFHQLTSNAYDDGPAIAPDGSLVAFDRYDPIDGHADIYTISPDGTGLTLVAGGPAQNRSPAFSPDGSTIAYSCGLAQPVGGPIVAANVCGPTAGGSWAEGGLMLMMRTGNAKRMISRYIGREPAWAPDGATIAIADTRGSDSNGQIYAVRSDGEDLDTPHPLTDTNGPGGFMPSFSSDGRSIIFGSTWWQQLEGNFFLLMNADGSGLVRLVLQGNIPARFIPPAIGGAVPPTVDVEHVIVPKLETMSVTTAKRTLKSAGCRLGSVSKRYSRSVRAGRVIAQRPRASVRVHRGTRVSLVVSRGRPQTRRR